MASKIEHTVEILSRLHDEILRLTDMRLPDYDAVDSYREIRGLQKAMQIVRSSMNSDGIQDQTKTREDNVKELRIEYDGNGGQLDRVVFNGETYELRSKRACKVELTCEPNERPVLRIEYVGREKG